MSQSKYNSVPPSLRPSARQDTCSLIGRVRLEGPQTQDVHRPITLLAGADNPVFCLSSFFPSVTWEFMLIPVCLEERTEMVVDSLYLEHMAIGCHLFASVASGADAVFLPL